AGLAGRHGEQQQRGQIDQETDPEEDVPAPGTPLLAHHLQSDLLQRDALPALFGIVIPLVCHMSRSVPAGGSVPLPDPHTAAPSGSAVRHRASATSGSAHAGTAAVPPAPETAY